jgi:decaprenylphosphoryl-5-phosphoribose phosphatase
VLRAFDLAALRLLRTRGHSPRAEGAVAALSRAGENGAVWYALALVGAASDPLGRAAYRRAALAVTASFLASQAVKLAVRRARPASDELPALIKTISGRSYPSSHAATSFAAARVLRDPLPPGPLYCLAAAMALSRPYLGVHYPSDALAGGALGDAVARLLP